MTTNSQIAAYVRLATKFVQGIHTLRCLFVSDPSVPVYGRGPVRLSLFDVRKPWTM